jgi:CheY-like chemotaxis protein
MGASRGDILVVDDDADIRDTVASILETAGYPVRTSANGQEAVAAIELERPALVLLDLMMPVMSGLEVLERVERDRLLPLHRVLVMSAADGRCPEGFPLVRKPFELKELLAAVRERTQ